MLSAQIDKRYFDAPYTIVPTDAVGQKAFAVIRDAMRGKGMVALGRVVLAKRERVIALEPYEKGLLATTLRYPYEVRDAAAYFEDVADTKVPAELLKLAEHILDSKSNGRWTALPQKVCEMNRKAQHCLAGKASFTLHLR